MPGPLADNPRLHPQVATVLRQQAAEAVQLSRELHRDEDLARAVSSMVERVRDTARVMGLGQVERAALRALRGMRSPTRLELLEELLETCSGGIRVAAMLRPIVVVSGGEDTSALHRSAQLTSAAVRIVPDMATARAVAEREDAAAVVAPAGLLSGGADEAWLRDRLLLAYGSEQDLPSRVAAARLGAALYLPEPLELKQVVRMVRGRLAAWRHSAWRVLLAHNSRALVDDLAAALACEELHTIGAVGGYRLLQEIDATGPDLVVIAAPLDGLPMGELTAMLVAHHRFGNVPHLFLWEDGLVPSALTGHDAVQGQPDIPVLRARILGVLDDRRRESALRERDELTGVLSPAAVLNAADREIGAARRRSESVVAIRFEVDDAPALEARGGPMALAEALRLLAQVTQAAVRETDIVGVISSAGLLVVMSHCTAAMARERVVAVRRRFAQRVAGDDRLVGTTVTVGIADGLDDPLYRAERQLLRALGVLGEPGDLAPAIELGLRLGEATVPVGPRLD